MCPTEGQANERGQAAGGNAIGEWVDRVAVARDSADERGARREQDEHGQSRQQRRPELGAAQRGGDADQEQERQSPGVLGWTEQPGQRLGAVLLAELGRARCPEQVSQSPPLVGYSRLVVDALVPADALLLRRTLDQLEEHLDGPASVEQRVAADRLERDRPQQRVGLSLAESQLVPDPLEDLARLRTLVGDVLGNLAGAGPLRRLARVGADLLLIEDEVPLVLDRARHQEATSARRPRRAVHHLVADRPRDDDQREAPDRQCRCSERRAPRSVVGEEGERQHDQHRLADRSRQRGQAKG